MLQFSTRFMSFGESGGMSIFRDWSVCGTGVGFSPTSSSRRWSNINPLPELLGKLGKLATDGISISHDFWFRIFRKNLSHSHGEASTVLSHLSIRIHQNPRVDPMFDHFWCYFSLFFYRWYTWCTSSPSAQDDGWQNALLGAQLHRSSAGRFATPQSCCATQQWMDTDKKARHSPFM